MQLRDPVFLGSGGGGAVFAMTDTAPSGSDDGNSGKVAVKISWESSAASVANECHILQILQANRVTVTGVEQCLASAPYPTPVNKNGNDDSNRIMIAIKPVVEGAVVNSISELPSREFQIRAVEQVCQTLVQMLHANVVTTDVQFLLTKTTGQLLFIDMTEAQVMSQPPDFLQLALCNSFVSEMMALIPKSLETVAAQALDRELRQVAPNLQPQVKEILKEVVPFVSSESLDLLR